MPFPSLPGTDVPGRRGAGVFILGASGLLLFLMKGKIQYGRVRMSLSLAVLLVYIAVLCSGHRAKAHNHTGAT